MNTYRHQVFDRQIDRQLYGWRLQIVRQDWPRNTELQSCEDSAYFREIRPTRLKREERERFQWPEHRSRIPKHQQSWKWNQCQRICHRTLYRQESPKFEIASKDYCSCLADQHMVIKMGYEYTIAHNLRCWFKEKGIVGRHFVKHDFFDAWLASTWVRE